MRALAITQSVLGMAVFALAACTPASDVAAMDDAAFGPDEAEHAMAEVEIPDFTGIPDWRLADPENLLLIETRHGMVTVELAPEFAPNHAERMRQAARAGFFDGREFYRVIDGFVAQGGRGGEAASGALPQYPVLAGEFARSTTGIVFTAMIDDDLYAPRVGHVSGFPAGQSADGSQAWLLHCPGTMAMARETGPDTGDVEFYIVLGQGPRYLDRNMSVFGRVIDGMDHVQALNRGDPMVDSGVIADPALRDPILSIRVAADLPEAQRPTYEIMRTDGQAFFDLKTARRHRTGEFFFETPPAVIEACHVPARARRVN